MVISRKPLNNKKSAELSLIDEIIDKGGSVPERANNIHKNKEFKFVKVRIPTVTLAQIDLLLDSLMIEKSRTSWIIEALIEKVEREKKRIKKY